MGRAQWAGFTLLCLLSATSWVVPTSSAVPLFEEQGIRYGVIGLVGIGVGVRGLRGLSWGRIAAIGAGFVAFFGVPIVLVEVARGSVGELTRSAVFAMTPVSVVVFGTVMDGEMSGGQRFLVPALSGAGGLLLLLPLTLPGTLDGRLMLALLVGAAVLSGVAAVWLYQLLQGVGLWEAMGIAGVSNCLFLMLAAAARKELVWGGMAGVVSFGSLVDVVEVVLLVWLVREMMPVRFAARYLLIPLITVVESYDLQWPGLSARMAAGTLLLAVGTGAMLFWNPEDERETLSLR